MKKKTILDFKNMAAQDEKITMLTGYDYPTARILEKAGIDTILVGDSLGMTVLGYESTVSVTIEEMIHHSKAVRRGAPNTFVIVDMPYLSYATPVDALQNAGRLIKEGRADAVKLEGGQDYFEIVNFLTTRGVPVVGHIGLTPQTATQLGGFRVQGKDIDSASRLLQDAQVIQKAGAIMLVLEAIPSALAGKITEELTIPTIGIGAGERCSGQVLVFHDLVGLFDKFVPKFVKQYETLENKIEFAVNQYCKEVKELIFPSNENSFTLNDEVLNKLYGDKEL